MKSVSVSSPEKLLKTATGLLLEPTVWPTDIWLAQCKNRPVNPSAIRFLASTKNVVRPDGRAVVVSAKHGVGQMSVGQVVIRQRSLHQIL